jgi:acyl-ACP thioesterase
MPPHREIFLTRRHEAGMDRLLRVQCLCNYMEEAAGAHAELLGVGLDRLAEDRLAWILARMRLLLYRRPGPGETVCVETWPVGMERVQFRRDFRLLDAAGNILATAVTQWVVMGTLSRRLERFPLYIADLAPENPPPARESGDIRVPPVGQGATGPHFPVRLADIDQNHHVNNGRFVDFTLEAAEAAGACGELRRLDIIFRAEGLRGDTIGSRSSREQGEPGGFLHCLYRENTGQELARSRTIFV